MKKFFKLAPVLGTLLGMSALAQTPSQPKEPSSPQQKIVQKYGLENTLKAVDIVNDLDGNTGCHQPAGDRDEIATYKDFRLVSQRANSQKNLLFVCDSIQGFRNATVNTYSHPALGVAWVTKGFTHLPQKTRRDLLGHEDTHVFNKDDLTDPRPEINRFNALEAQIAVLIQQVRTGQTVLQPYQVTEIVRQEADLRKQAIDALDNAAIQNHPMEERADRGGLILAAGKQCKIDPEPLIAGLEAMYDTMPAWTSQGTFSHPALTERESDLRDTVPDTVTACRNYYSNRKHHKPDKRPGLH